ncbi:hypothetical protein QAD02_000431 [Eretmocerus hayati]|uniref:Uncharacterized protein n=1 Tax=Eretmocerus hayati TaxID=131215 RepID=A0ACC2NDK8_9HYME|nr:hypothetical protein QAD02_000431 [Eretmocerus hayati]
MGQSVADTSEHTPQHTCESDRDVFCHICGEFELRTNRRSITEANKIAYKECYGFAMSVMAWSPTSLCSRCRVMLQQSRKFKGKDSLRIASPASWRRPSSREDCYFCMTDVQGFSAKTKHRIKYAIVPTMTKPELSPILCQRAPISIVSDVEFGSENVRQSEDGIGIETDEAERARHGIEEDRGEQEAEVQDDRSDETSSNETSADEDGEEYIPAGGKSGPELGQNVNAINEDRRLADHVVQGSDIDVEEDVGPENLNVPEILIDGEFFHY